MVLLNSMYNLANIKQNCRSTVEILTKQINYLSVKRIPFKIERTGNFESCDMEDLE
jgi:hypothetical protein